MENLWKKDAKRSEYIDVFRSVENFSSDMLIEVFKTKTALKNNQKSTELRLKGNDFFRQKNWMQAIELYNKSLCFAEVGSENEALAYSNRSACYFHMMLFNEVLVDIELALNANLPNHLIPMLKQRRSESLKQISSAKHLPNSEPKLSYEADENFPCMANVIEIKSDEEFGRHLVAKCDIPVGKTILVENDIPRIMNGISVCYTCLRVHSNCVACPNCTEVAYCSTDCMKTNQIHEWECGSIFPHLDIEMKFLIKTILIAITSFPNLDDLMQFVEVSLLDGPEILPISLKDPRSKYHFFFKLSILPASASNLANAYKVYTATINLPKISELFDSNRKMRFLMHLTLHHFLISYANVFVDKENYAYVPNVSALLNHSCAPNIVSSRCQVTKNLFSVTGRPIRAGEQLFLKYSGFEHLSTKERKEKSKSNWGFVCKCEKCKPKRVSINRKQIAMDPSYKYVVKNQHNTSESSIIREKCIEFLNKHGSAWSPEIEFVSNVYEQHLANV